jgi:hypothetical protein
MKVDINDDWAFWSIGIEFYRKGSLRTEPRKRLCLTKGQQQNPFTIFGGKILDYGVRSSPSHCCELVPNVFWRRLSAQTCASSPLLGRRTHIRILWMIPMCFRG